jgi:hypothetical protein
MPFLNKAKGKIRSDFRESFHYFLQTCESDYHKNEFAVKAGRLG